MLDARSLSDRRDEIAASIRRRGVRADLDGEMRRIAAFLGIAVDPAVWASLVHAAEFAQMQAAGKTLMPHAEFG